MVNPRQVVPALVERLPLKEDMEENKTVFGCLAMLYTHSPALVRTNSGYTRLTCFEPIPSCWFFGFL